LNTTVRLGFSSAGREQTAQPPWLAAQILGGHAGAERPIA